MKFENLFYHGTSVGVHSPTRAIPCLKFWKWGRGPAKVGPYSIPPKRISGWSDSLVYAIFPISPLYLLHWKHVATSTFPLSPFHGKHMATSIFPISPFHWKHMATSISPIPQPHDPQTLKAHGNMLSSPIPPSAESTWKHAFSKDLLYGFVNIFL